MLEDVMLCNFEISTNCPFNHLLQDQIIFELLYTIKALFLLSPLFNEKMLDNLCVIHQIMTCMWWVMTYLHRRSVHAFIKVRCASYSSGATRCETQFPAAHASCCGPDHDLRPVICRVCRGIRQMCVQVLPPVDLVQAQRWRAYVQESTALIYQNQNQPDAVGLIRLIFHQPPGCQTL